MSYKEPLIIHADLAYNPNIKGEALIVCGLMLKFQKEGEEKTNTEIAKIRGLKKRVIQKYKKELVKFGACEAVTDAAGKVLKYIPIDPHSFVIRKMNRFIMEFSKYFNPIAQTIFLDLQGRDADRCYFIMSGLEFQYRHSTKKKEIGNAWALLRDCFNGSFNPVKAFTDPDWWIHVIEKPKRKAAEAVQAKHDQAAKEQEKGDFTAFISGLSKAEYDRLHNLAICAMKENGGVPKGIGSKKLIEFEMYECRSYV